MMCSRKDVKAHLVRFGLVAALVAGCADEKLFKPYEVSSLPEAGSFHISVLSVAPWQDVAEELKPKFKVESAEALLAKVMPTVQTQDDKYISGLMVGIKLGLFGTMDAAGKPLASTSANTPTPSAEEPTKGRLAKDLPDLLKGQYLADKDPFLEYREATSLYQEIALLNNYVQKAAISSNTVPYLVRVQLTSMPYAHSEPYDIYADLSFLPPIRGAIAPGRVAPKVIPLLVTDQINLTQHARSVELIKQLNLTLSGMAQGITGQGDVKYLSDNLKSVLGREQNSAFTIGNLSDNMIRVRLGASPQPNSGFAMIPRTHTASLLVMVPKELFALDNATGEKSAPIQITGEFDLRNTDTGKSLREKFRHLSQSSKFEDQLRSAFYQCGLIEASFEHLFHAAIGLADSIISRDVTDFTKKAGEAGCKPNLMTQPNIQLLWVELEKLGPILGKVVTTFDAKDYGYNRPTIMPPSQTATLIDDGETATVSFAGGMGTPDAARLEFDGISLPTGAKDAITRDGSNLVIKFPSLVGLKVNLKGQKLVVRAVCNGCYVPETNFQNDCKKSPSSPPPTFNAQSSSNPPKSGAACYPVTLIKKPAPAKPAQASKASSFEMKTGTTQVVAINGQATLPVSIAITDKDAVDSVKVSVQGPSLVSATPGTIDSSGGVVVTSSGVVALSLNNAAQGGKVVLAATGLLKGKPVGDSKKLDISITGPGSKG